jgi:oxygen-dependent protoporphyrinogen oxidase
MRGKLLFVTGAAVGYVLGTRAGRERYDQLKAAAAKVWGSPGVQKQVHAAEDFVAEKVGEFPETVYVTVKKFVVRANERRRESRAPYPSPAAEAAIRAGDGRSDTAS